jgi:putative PIN family toxin of toxin-antitoxin system
VKVVLDTNVILSAALVGGLSGRILDAWRNGALVLTVSAEIMQEYERAGAALERRYPGVCVAPFLRLVERLAQVVTPAAPFASVCRDPNDGKFLACAEAGGAAVIVSGDKDLLAVGEYAGVRVLTPRAFVEAHLS